MNRRNFTQNIGILGSALLLPKINYAMTGKSKYKLGLQLFSIHKDMTKNPIDYS